MAEFGRVKLFFEGHAFLSTETYSVLGAEELARRLASEVSGSVLVEVETSYTNEGKWGSAVPEKGAGVK